MPKILFSKIKIYEFKDLIRSRKRPKTLDVLLSRKKQKSDIQCVLVQDVTCVSVSSVSRHQDKTSVPTLENLLNDKQGLSAFRLFLQSEYSEENIEFWLACREYKNATSTNKLSHKAAEIYDEFLHPASKKEVNIDYHTREKIKRSLLDPDLSCFDEAEIHVYRLMEKDSCPRFLKSQVYRELQTKPRSLSC
ncbi:regulator of G-protein signaling 21 [Chanos chanos]|uniref:Regulator of G-protein signaling 21 n=1 Tax=Chanos chanos TaxID=29144 RepID=A0A6J2W800_CHACN|nr:regulator of G-protein signaling 21-like [Chanos chanos]